ncbi:fimbria/pilus outer membrane usher protein [Vibrio owensii]|uniref:fimbria/pilus outer membrane usher protein n=1 Tax=Vibrio owensii TaxID=696485 RepID=UPI0003A3409A|nr:fimbria/pilus outer membrane usher protein [Vibrio owensii]
MSLRINVAVFLLIYTSVSLASDHNYQLDFIQGDLSNFDSSWLTSKIAVGTHSVDVVLNEQGSIPRNPISMKLDFIETKEGIQPCFNTNQLSILGVAPNVDQYRANYCYLVSDISVDARYKYSGNISLVRLYVPNVNIQQTNHELMTNPDIWEHGINSLKFNYNSYVSVDEDEEVDGYVSVNALLSLGPWRIKHNGSLYRSQYHTQSMTGDLYAYTDIDHLRSEVAFGQISSTSGLSVNSSIPILGMKQETSEVMYSPNWGRYAPVIRGRVNSTSAKVSVFDNQRVVYSEVFNTGEFEITEFDITAVGSELKLIIEESDGTTREKTIPYTKLPDMLRNNTYKYSFAFGRYRNDFINTHPMIATGRFQYGFESFTAEIAAFLTEDYQYIEVANAFDFGNFGAVSIGAGLSNAQNESGYLLQTSYAKHIDSTKTSLQFVGTQYRSDTFMTFDDFVSSLSLRDPIKNTFDLSLTQQFSDISFYLGYRNETYHEIKLKNKWSLYGSVNFMLGDVDVSLNVTKDEQENYKQNSQVVYGLNVSIPLDIISDARLSNYFTQRENNTFNTLSFSKEHNNDTYNIAVQSEFGDVDTQHSISGSVKKKTDVADLEIRGYWKDEYQKLTLSAKGGGIAHSGGLVLAPYVNDTSAIVDFGDGAEDIILNQSQYNKTNRNGQGIVPYARSYKSNSISLDTTQSSNTEINEMPRRFVPRKGATILVNVDASVGVRKLVKIISDENLFSVPVKRMTGEQVTYVGMDNVAYLSGLKDNKLESFKLGGNIECQFDLDMSIESEDINELAYVECKG